MFAVIELFDPLSALDTRHELKAVLRYYAVSAAVASASEDALTGTG